MEKRKKKLTAIGILALVYFVTGKLGLSLAFVHPSSTAIWPPTGIALAAFLILGYDVWPGVVIGAFLVNLTTAGSIFTSLAIAAGNTCEGLSGAYLVNRFAKGTMCFERSQDIFKFAILAGMCSPIVSATIGVTSLSLGGYAKWINYGPIWWTWWLGDAVGAIVIAPLLILWKADFRVRWNWPRMGEYVALIVGMCIVGQVVFNGLFLRHEMNYPLEYLCIPFLIWAAFRFNQRDAATATLVLSAIATWGTFHGYGPFIHGSRNTSLLLLQSFMGVVAVMTIALAAESAERQLAGRRARALAETDALTGLANYRRFMDVLAAEIRRYGRSGRPFAVLLLDLDGLKKINDRYGHLAGSRALCRLGQILQSYSRGVDTAARYGGDEFALVITEADERSIGEVSRRIREQLANDDEFPPLSVSIGGAMYPRDGETPELLLSAADAALYQMKRGQHKKSSSPISAPHEPTRR